MIMANLMVSSRTSGPRIAYVINSMEGGGAALPVPSIVEVMRSAGCHVEIFALTRRDGKALPPLEQAGIRVHIRKGKERNNLAALCWLNKNIKKYKPDLIWTSLTRATLLGQLVGYRHTIPVVSWQHAGYLKSINAFLLRRLRRLSRLWIGDSTAITEITRKKLRIADQHLTTWPIFCANPSAPQATQWHMGQKIKIASLGRLHPVKGYDILIDALALIKEKNIDLPDFEVTICGEGQEHARLQEKITHAGLTCVKLNPFTSHPLNFLAEHHLYVQPSRSEGLCVAAHEAMQCGLPVVASAVGQLAFSIRNNVTGFTVSPDHAELLADALIKILARPEQLAIMGKNGRDYIFTHFSKEQFFAKGQAILKQIFPTLNI